MTHEADSQRSAWLRQQLHSLVDNLSPQFLEHWFEQAMQRMVEEKLEKALK